MLEGSYNAMSLHFNVLTHMPAQTTSPQRPRPWRPLFGPPSPSWSWLAWSAAKNRHRSPQLVCRHAFPLHRSSPSPRRVRLPRPVCVSKTLDPGGSRISKHRKAIKNFTSTSAVIAFRASVRAASIASILSSMRLSAPSRNDFISANKGRRRINALQDM